MRITASPATSSRRRPRCPAACSAPTADCARGVAAGVGARDGEARCRRVVEREVEQHEIAHAESRRRAWSPCVRRSARATRRRPCPATWIAPPGKRESARARSTATPAAAMRSASGDAIAEIAVHGDARRRRLLRLACAAPASPRPARSRRSRAPSCGRESRPRRAPAAAPTARSADRGSTRPRRSSSPRD